MATGNFGWYATLPGFVASSSLASSQWCPVKLSSTAGYVTACTANTDVALGILMNNPGTGEVAEIAVLGVVKAKAEAAVNAGSYVCPSTTGRVVTTTDANDDVLGVAVEAAGAAGDLVTIILAHFNY